MLSGAAGDSAAAVIFDGDDMPDDVLAGCFRQELPLSERCIEADVFTYAGRTLVIARPAAPLHDRFSASMRIKRNSGTR